MRIRLAWRDWRRSARTRAPNKETARDEFWALRDFSMQVAAGESVAIIGPNGAGKSTALKLLAGILPPTRGTIRVQGRVSALIEVGAGFHPDLTGRENIYLNAAVLGLSQARTRHVFDDIVDFAELAAFLDTPLKRYSSGMYARLGFAVAAHVEPDVLLVDEVLSVGDRVFRAKCMDRMREFKKKGVAIVFVSHDLSAVTAFCDRAVVLNRGQTVFSGGAVEGVAHYHRASQRIGSDVSNDAALAAEAIELANAEGGGCRTFESGDRMAAGWTVRGWKDVLAASAISIRIIRVRDRALVFESAPKRIGMNPEGSIDPKNETGDVVRFHAGLTLNLPPGEYTIQCEMRQVEGKSAAVDEPEEVAFTQLERAKDDEESDCADLTLPLCRCETDFLIRGPITSGGLIEVSPTFEIRRISNPPAWNEAMTSKSRDHDREPMCGVHPS